MPLNKNHGFMSSLTVVLSREKGGSPVEVRAHTATPVCAGIVGVPSSPREDMHTSLDALHRELIQQKL